MLRLEVAHRYSSLFKAENDAGTVPSSFAQLKYRVFRLVSADRDAGTVPLMLLPPRVLPDPGGPERTLRQHNDVCKAPKAAVLFGPIRHQLIGTHK